jgi:hypothetical protein
LSPELEVLPLSELNLLREVQPRTKTDRATVKRYAQAMANGTDFPPILVANLKGVLILLDGFHRVAAMTSLNMDQTPAEVHEVATLEEARWLAAKANLTHGLPLKARDRRAVFRAYVGASQHRKGGPRGVLKSYREMAADLGGVHYTTLRNWTRCDFPSVFAAIGGDTNVGLGGLPEPEPPGRLFAREASEALDKALAALAGVTEPEDRGWLLTKVEALKEALEDAGVKEELPF